MRERVGSRLDGVDAEGRLAGTGIWDEPLERLLPEQVLAKAPSPRASDARGDRSQIALDETQRTSKERVLSSLKAQQNRGSQRDTADDRDRERMENGNV